MSAGPAPTPSDPAPNKPKPPPDSGVDSEADMEDGEDGDGAVLGEESGAAEDDAAEDDAAVQDASPEFDENSQAEEDAAPRRNMFVRFLLSFWPSRDALPSDRSTHVTLLIISFLLITLPLIVSYDANATTAPDMLGWKMPQTCYTQVLFGTECPGCGLTRSFSLLAHFEFRDSLRLHRVGWLLFLYFAWQVYFRGRCVFSEHAS